MRKQTKKVLSWILSAAMTLGLATGSGFAAQKASAADDATADNGYTFTLIFGALQGKGGTPSATVTKSGDYSVSGQNSDWNTEKDILNSNGEKTQWAENCYIQTNIPEASANDVTFTPGNLSINDENLGKYVVTQKTDSDGFIQYIINAPYDADWKTSHKKQPVLDLVANAIVKFDFNIKLASDAEATGTPEVTGTPAASTTPTTGDATATPASGSATTAPTTGGAVTGDATATPASGSATTAPTTGGAVTGDATATPATSKAPDASEEPVESTEPDNTVYATMIYGDSSWKNGHWNPGEEGGTDAKITGNGTYTVSYEKAGVDLDLKNVFCVDLVKFSTLENYDKAKISDIKISVDKKELDVAQNIYYYPAGKENKDKQDELIEELNASDKPAILVGDIEDKGNLRIELYNTCGINGGKTLNKPAFDINTVGSKISVTFTLSGLTDDPSVAENDKIWNQEGVHAYVYYQTDGTWDCRNDYGAAVKGKVPEEVDAFAKYSYRYILAGGANVSMEADVTDVLIKEDGTYTVKIAGIDLSNAPSFTQLGISTDLAVPEDEQKAGKKAADAGKDFDWSVSVSDVTVKIDGETVPEGLDKCVLPHNAESPYYLFTAANKWSDNEKIPYNKGTDPLKVLPEDSIEITFTIKGIPTASAAPTQTTTPGTSVTPAAIATATPDTVLVKKGTTVSVGNFKYKVTKAATAKTAGTVKLAGLTKKGKKAKKLTLPASISIKKNSAKLNVTALGGSAFKGAKATSITIKSKKVTKLPSKVFANCKKLKSLKLAAKLKSVNKKAFKGCKKTIKIKGASKKANKKVIKKVYKKTK